METAVKRPSAIIRAIASSPENHLTNRIDPMQEEDRTREVLPIKTEPMPLTTSDVRVDDS